VEQTSCSITLVFTGHRVLLIDAEGNVWKTSLALKISSPPVFGGEDELRS